MKKKTISVDYYDELKSMTSKCLSYELCSMILYKLLTKICDSLEENEHQELDLDIWLEKAKSALELYEETGKINFHRKNK